MTWLSLKSGQAIPLAERRVLRVRPVLQVGRLGPRREASRRILPRRLVPELEEESGRKRRASVVAP